MNYLFLSSDLAIFKNRHILRDAIVDNISPCLDFSLVTDKEVSVTDFVHALHLDCGMGSRNFH